MSINKKYTYNKEYFNNINRSLKSTRKTKESLKDENIKFKKMIIDNQIIGDFYETPEECSKIIVNDINKMSKDKNYFDFDNEINFLEPNAGLGAILRVLIDNLKLNKPYNIDAIEYNENFYKILKENISINNIYNEDFLRFKPNKFYDIIIMNPPYGGRIGGKNEKEIFFYHLIKAIILPFDFIKYIYIISPDITKNKNESNELDKLSDALKKRISKYFGIDMEDLPRIMIEKLGNCSGFFNIKNSSKMGLTENIYKITVEDHNKQYNKLNDSVNKQHNKLNVNKQLKKLLDEIKINSKNKLSEKLQKLKPKEELITLSLDILKTKLDLQNENKKLDLDLKKEKKLFDELFNKKKTLLKMRNDLDKTINDIDKVLEESKKVQSKKIQSKKVEDKKVEDKKVEDKKVKDKKVEDKKVEDKKVEDKKVEDKKVEDKKEKENIERIYKPNLKDFTINTYELDMISILNDKLRTYLIKKKDKKQAKFLNDITNKIFKVYVLLLNNNIDRINYNQLKDLISKNFKSDKSMLDVLNYIENVETRKEKQNLILPSYN